MAKIKEVTVNYGVTVSYKKYRFVRLEYGLTVDLEGEDSSDKIDDLRRSLRMKVKIDAKKEVKQWRKLINQVEALDEVPDVNFD